jgi:hypothetical protein
MLEPTECEDRRSGWYRKYPWLSCEIGCSYGWDGVLDRLFTILDSHWNRLESPEEERFKVVQVKEKFGTLRVYTDGADERVYGLIDMAESVSGMLCETCGSSPASTGGKGWVRTLCPACRSA